MAHILLAVLVSGFVFSLTDWLFGGVLFHDKYAAHPEIWRLAPGESETRSVVCSVALGFLTAAAFMAACLVFAIRGFRPAFEFAGLCWLMIPVPLLITNAFWIKMHPLVAVSHSFGWLAKLCVAALAAAWLLR
jgi:hypothetical protein